jgi:hypothetical protein
MRPSRNRTEQANIITDVYFGATSGQVKGGQWLVTTTETMSWLEYFRAFEAGWCGFELRRVSYLPFVRPPLGYRCRDQMLEWTRLLRQF